MPWSRLFALVLDATRTVAEFETWMPGRNASATVFPTMVPLLAPLEK
jgi:hypothetical protein